MANDNVASTASDKTEGLMGKVLGAAAIKQDDKKLSIAKGAQDIDLIKAKMAAAAQAHAVNTQAQTWKEKNAGDSMNAEKDREVRREGIAAEQEEAGKNRIHDLIKINKAGEMRKEEARIDRDARRIALKESREYEEGQYDERRIEGLKDHAQQRRENREDLLVGQLDALELAEIEAKERGDLYDDEAELDRLAATAARGMEYAGETYGAVIKDVRVDLETKGNVINYVDSGWMDVQENMEDPATAIEDYLTLAPITEMFGGMLAGNPAQLRSGNMTAAGRRKDRTMIEKEYLGDEYDPTEVDFSISTQVEGQLQNEGTIGRLYPWNWIVNSDHYALPADHIARNLIQRWGREQMSGEKRLLVDGLDTLVSAAMAFHRGDLDGAGLNSAIKAMRGEGKETAVWAVLEGARRHNRAALEGAPIEDAPTLKKAMDEVDTYLGELMEHLSDHSDKFESLEGTQERMRAVQRGLRNWDEVDTEQVAIAVEALGSYADPELLRDLKLDLTKAAKLEAKRKAFEELTRDRARSGSKKARSEMRSRFQTELEGLQNE